MEEKLTQLISQLRFDKESKRISYELKELASKLLNEKSYILTSSGSLHKKLLVGNVSLSKKVKVGFLPLSIDRLISVKQKDSFHVYEFTFSKKSGMLNMLEEKKYTRQLEGGKKNLLFNTVEEKWYL